MTVESFHGVQIWIDPKLGFWCWDLGECVLDFISPSCYDHSYYLRYALSYEL